MMMHSKLSVLVQQGHFLQGSDGIYSACLPVPTTEQETEHALREQVASRQYENYLSVISRNHSISVMDYEVDRFLAVMPKDAFILDIGGCWGWHWRRLAETRPDVGVLIIDFVRANLAHARNILGTLVGNQVELMHADATSLPFLDSDAAHAPFDGVWTVQVFQHIPDFALVCREAHRVLKLGGRFVNYALHATPLNRAIYRLLGRQYHMEGLVKNLFYLCRAGDRQRSTLENIFGARVISRYTECLFHPDLRLTFAGCTGSMLGRLDARLGDVPWLGRWIARQRAFEISK